MRLPPDLATPSKATTSRKTTDSPTRTSNAFPPVAVGGSIRTTRARVDIFFPPSSSLLHASQRQFRLFLARRLLCDRRPCQLGPDALNYIVELLLEAVA